MVATGSNYYLDTSALVKLVVTEPETRALRRLLSGAATLLASRVAAVELRRVARRQGQRRVERQVEALLQGLALIELDEGIAQTAGSLAPASLRSLDAIHLASALALAEDLEAFITYDLRLADAAAAAGLSVLSPG